MYTTISLLILGRLGNIIHAAKNRLRLYRRSNWVFVCFLELRVFQPETSVQKSSWDKTFCTVCSLFVYGMVV